MAKKTKRKVSSGITSEIDAVQAPVAVEAPAPARTTPVVTRRGMSAAEFNPDYRYVISDLKRIGILASIFFVILIALSFIL